MAYHGRRRIHGAGIRWQRYNPDNRACMAFDTQRRVIFAPGRLPTCRQVPFLVHSRGDAAEIYIKIIQNENLKARAEVNGQFRREERNLVSGC